MIRANLTPDRDSNQIDLCNISGKDSTQAEFRRAVKNFRKLLLTFKTSEIEKAGSFFPLKNDILHIATLLIRATDQNTLPINLTPISKKMLIHSIVADPRISPFSASLVPDENGFTLRIKKTSNEARKRAIIAHEIGHTLFYNVNKVPPTRILRYRPKKAYMDKEEWISWDFARELLLPKQFLLREFALEYPLPPSEIVEIARKTGVSVELLCHRLILDLGLWNNCALFISDVYNGNLRTDTLKVYRTDRFPRFFIKGKKGLVNLNHKIAKMVGTIIEDRVRYDSDYIKFQDVFLWIKMLRFSNIPQRVLCLLEIPFANYQFNVLSKNGINRISNKT